jgi:hypothetical protein
LLRLPEQWERELIRASSHLRTYIVWKNSDLWKIMSMSMEASQNFSKQNLHKTLPLSLQISPSNFF